MRRLVLAAALIAVLGTTPVEAAPARVPSFVHVLTASPQSVTVGDVINLVMNAADWPHSATVAMSFRSQHHAWSGPGIWNTPCQCFQAQVRLLVKVHPSETAQAVAKIVMEGKTYWARTQFTILGAQSLVNAPSPVQSSADLVSDTNARKSGWAFGWEDTDSAIFLDLKNAVAAARDTDGHTADSNCWFLFVDAGEWNDGHALYFSSSLDFEVQDESGQIYSANVASAPPGNSDASFAAVRLPSRGSNRGWLSFQVPRGDGDFALLWQTQFGGPWETVARIHVTSGGRASISP